MNNSAVFFIIWEPKRILFEIIKRFKNWLFLWKTQTGQCVLLSEFFFWELILTREQCVNFEWVWLDRYGFLNRALNLRSKWIREFNHRGLLCLPEPIKRAPMGIIFWWVLWTSYECIMFFFCISINVFTNLYNYIYMLALGFHQVIHFIFRQTALATVGFIIYFYFIIHFYWWVVFLPFLNL